MSTTNFNFTAPVAKGKVKNPNLMKLPEGPNVLTCYGIVDVGTHTDVWNGKEKKARKVYFIFESPLFLQQYYEGEPLKPEAVSIKHNFIFSEGSNLKKFCSNAMGVDLKYEDYKDGWDVAQLLGKSFICEIKHKPSKKVEGDVWYNIVGIKPINDAAKKTYNFEWDKIPTNADGTPKPYNDYLTFAIAPNGANFNTDEFAKLWKNHKNDIIDKSKEGLDYKAKGGVFKMKLDEKESETPAAGTFAAPQTGGGQVHKATPMQQNAFNQPTDPFGTSPDEDPDDLPF